MRSSAAGSGGGDFEHRLGSRAHPYVAAFLQFKPVTFGQVMRPRQVEQKDLARIGDKPEAAAMPVEICERHRVERFVFRPTAAGMNSNCPAYRA